MHNELFNASAWERAILKNKIDINEYVKIK